MEQIIGKLDREEKGNGREERATTGSSAVGSGGQWWAVAAMLGDMRLYLRQLPDSCGWWRPYRGAERAIDFGCNLELVLESWERASHYFNCSNFVISPLIETYQLQPGTRQLQLHFLSP